MSAAARLGLGWLAAAVAAGPAAATVPILERTVVDQTPALGSVDHSVGWAPATGEVVVGGFQVDRSVPDQTWARLRKLDTFGSVVWTLTVVGAAGLTNTVEQSVRSVAVVPRSGTSFDVAVAGELLANAGGGDAWIAVYDENGALRWSLTLDGAVPAGESSAEGIALTPTNELIVTGRMHNAAGYSQLWVARWDLAGNLQAGPNFLTAGTLDASGQSVAVEPSGSVYVAGYVTLPGPNRNAYVANLGVSLSTGAPVWQLVYDGAASSTDAANGVAVLPGGDAVVAGVTSGPTTRRDIWVARIAGGGAAMGTTVWSFVRDGANDDDQGRGIFADAAGLVTAVGDLNPATPNWSDFWAAQFDANGALQWEFDQDGSDNYVDLAWGVTGDTAGNLFLAGELFEGTGAGLGRCAALFKVRPGPPPIGVVATAAPPPNAQPNPYRPGTGGRQDAAGITFTHLPANAAVHLYTLDGHLVAELADTANAGFIVWNAKSQSGKSLASGVYVYVVTSPSAPTFRGKVVIVR